MGTTALLSRIQKQGAQLDFLAVDEQHKFSREQREMLVGRGTNYLEATATAIPRTMALVSHAGMKVSQLAVRPFERSIILWRDGNTLAIMGLQFRARRGIVHDHGRALLEQRVDNA